MTSTNSTSTTWRANMAKPWRQIQAAHSKRTPEEREQTRARALRDLAIENMTLSQLRRARRFTQATMAEAAGMAQGDVSRLEHRTDAYIGTVRRFVEALGGKLSMLVEFPDAAPVEIRGFGDTTETEAKYDHNDRTETVLDEHPATIREDFTHAH